MKLKATVAFYDLKAGKGRRIGEEFDADAERAAHLIGKGFAEEAGKAAGTAETEVKAEEPKADAKPKRTRKTK